MCCVHSFIHFRILFDCSIRRHVFLTSNLHKIIDTNNVNDQPRFYNRQRYSNCHWFKPTIRQKMFSLFSKHFILFSLCKFVWVQSRSCDLQIAHNKVSHRRSVTHNALHRNALLQRSHEATMSSQSRDPKRSPASGAFFDHCLLTLLRC